MISHKSHMMKKKMQHGKHVWMSPENKTSLSRVLAIGAGLAAIVLIANFTKVPTTHPSAAGNQTLNEQKALDKAKNLQSPFIENIGQQDEAVKYYNPFQGGTFFVGQNGTLTYNFTVADTAKKDNSPVKGSMMPPPENRTSYAVKEYFVTDSKLVPVGIDPTPAQISTFVGKDENKWKNNIPNFQSVGIDVFKNIRVELKARSNTIEKIFTVNPGANPADIVMRLEGVKGLAINNEGELELSTPGGIFKFTKPVAYQELNGSRSNVEASYKILNDSEYGFTVGTYDKTQPLIIDPLVASTYLGGSADENGKQVAVDSGGNIFVYGSTTSTDFPATAYSMTRSGSNGDLFIAKFDSGLTTLLAATYFGG